MVPHFVFWASNVIANDPCAPKITPEGLDRSLPCSMGDPQTLELTPRVYFEPHSTLLDANAKANLNSKIEMINRHPEIVFNLKGYSDTTEAPKSKDRAKLGLVRAKSVEEYLIANGIAPSRLAATGASNVMMIPKANAPPHWHACGLCLSLPKRREHICSDTPHLALFKSHHPGPGPGFFCAAAQRLNISYCPHP